MFRRFLAAMLMVGLTACASIPNPIDLQTRDSIFVKTVSVAWSVQSKKPPTDAQKANDDDIQKKLRLAVEAKFKDFPSGSEPVEFNINIKKFSGTLVEADVVVHRISDGKVLGIYENVTGIHVSNGGLLGAVIEAAMKVDYNALISSNFATVLRARFQNA